ncbi:hypothetical protein N431DRAFT_450828 [Stipitochalara longipes BDJ]|nr:hypothetical protein N431DRAFT_450828 [Stipitochalara longipes BDJ]
MFPQPGRACIDEDSNNNGLIINQLREKREKLFRDRAILQYLKLSNTLPLPDPEFVPHTFEPGSDSVNPCRLNVEHLQDFCNKSTMIYFKGDPILDLEPMFDFILEHWLHLDPDAAGDIHKLDIEFARFFAKFAAFVDTQITTTQILNIHEALVKASVASHRTGFFNDNRYLRDYWFITGQQTEFFKVKPLLRALVIIIDKRIYKSSSETGEHKDFMKQDVRLVLTGPTAGLSQPITFNDGLAIINRINEHEVITSFSEAIRFVMELDQREEALLKKRDDKVLDYWLGLPLEQLRFNYSKSSRICKGLWTGAEEDVPVGPSTKWWKEGLECKHELPGLTGKYP